MVRRGPSRSARARASALVERGATIVREFGDETTEEFWIVMQEPEGNEFCIQ